MIRTPDQHLRVFVSSTLEELAAERSAARQAITQLHLTPVMFEGSARPYPPRDVYQAYLSRSDVFIGIYWQRYGWIEPGRDISGLEDEYRLSAGKPSLLYVKSPAPDREAALEALLERIRHDASTSYRLFTTDDELRQQVSDDLALLLTDRFVSSVEAGTKPVRRASPPAPRESILGREEELAELRALIEDPDVRLITLTGPGGVGKTTLALAAAAQSSGRFKDGVAYVSLASTMDHKLILSAIAAAVGLPENDVRSQRRRLLEYLQQRDLLLLVDNVEQVIGSAPLAPQTLELVPGLKILMTSREPLRVRGERVVPVAPLQVPPAGMSDTEDLDRLRTVPSVALFIGRARAAMPGFELTSDNAAAVAEICRKLDGIPLAIELAAARINVLTPESMLDRMRRGRLQLLSRGPRDLPERQQTLRSTFDWSYELLDDWDRAVFARLSVFVGGFTLDAAEAVCAHDETGGADLLTSLESLVDKSLIMHGDTGAQPDRFHMLDTIREYARDALADRSEDERIEQAHAAYFLDLAERASDKLRSREQAVWMERLRAERDNLRSAMGWSLRDVAGAASGLVPARRQLGVRMAAALWYFWFADGALVEGRRWLEGFAPPQGTGQVHDGSELAQATVVAAAGWLANVQNEDDRALALAERSLSLAGSAELEVTALAGATQGSAAINAGRFEQATAVFERSLEVARRAGSSWWTGIFLDNLGFAAYLSGDLDKGRGLIEESADLRRRTGDLRGLASSLLNLGSIAFADGDVRRAHLLYLQSLKLLVSGGGATPVATDLLEDLSGVLLARGESSLAVRMLGAVDAFRRAICMPEPGWRQSNLERMLRQLTQAVDPETYASLWAEGRKLRIEQAMSEVLASSGPVGPVEAAWVSPPNPRSGCSGPQRPPGRWKASRPRTAPSHRVPAPAPH